jgi:pimeloyl-ACP methyl ester carboxylesterase
MGAFVSSQAFLPPRHLIVSPPSGSVNAFVDLPRCGVRVPILFLRSAHPRAKTLFFAHGNAEDIQLLGEFAAFLAHNLRVNFCAFEYPGYMGTSWITPQSVPLVPSEYATLEAAEVSLQWLLRQEGIAAPDVVLYGRSLGSGSAVHLAAHCAQNNVPIGGLVLQSPIASAVRVVFPNIWFTLPFIDIFANVDKIGSVKCRTTIIHGTADEVVPVANAIHLESLIPAHLRVPALFIDGAFHNNIESQYTHVWLSHLARFVNE